jgi:hypothetical protein
MSLPEVQLQKASLNRLAQMGQARRGLGKAAEYRLKPVAELALWGHVVC